MINEQLSAYLDAETSASEGEASVNALLESAEMRDAFSRQRWLGETLRQSAAEPVAVALDLGFSQRVLARLESEEDVPLEDQANVVAMPARKFAPGWRRQVTGLAVAASVIGAVVLVSGPLQQQESPAELAANTPSQPVPQSQPTISAGISAGEVQPALASGLVSAQPAVTTARAPDFNQASQRDSAPADHWAVSDPALEDQLNGYLLEHDGLARGYGLTSATPSLMRVATYGQGARSQ